MPENESLLPEAFDPSVEEGSKFDLLPVDWYKAQITDALVSQPQSGDGWGIHLTWQITEGDYEGRLVWQRITFIHSSAQATIIGRRQFKDLCVATGVDEQVTDVSVFRFIPCQIRVGIERDKNGVYDDNNRVSRVLSIDAPTPAIRGSKAPKPAQQATKASPIAAGASPATTAVAKPAGSATGGANGNVPPWRQAKPSPSQDLDDEVPY